MSSDYLIIRDYFNPQMQHVKSQQKQVPIKSSMTSPGFLAEMKKNKLIVCPGKPTHASSKLVF